MTSYFRLDNNNIVNKLSMMAEKLTGVFYDGDPNYTEDIRNEVCDVVLEFANCEKIAAIREKDYRIYTLLLYQASELLINELHEKLLLKEIIRGNISRSKQIIFSPTFICILEQISYTKDNDIEKNGTMIKLNLPKQQLLKYTGYGFIKDESYPMLFLVALLHNAVVHGLASDENSHKVEVGLNVDSEFLILNHLVFAENMSNHESGNMVILDTVKYYYDQMAESSGNRTGLFSYSYEPLPNEPHIYTFTVKLPKIK